MKLTPILFIGIILLVSSVSAGTVASDWRPFFMEDDTNKLYEVGIYNSSVQMQDKVAPGTTPWDLWMGSGLLGVGLLLLALGLTMRSGVGIPELERGVIMCLLSVLPLGFCAFASFGIDRIVGSGVTSQSACILPEQSTTTSSIVGYVYMENHLIYTEPLVGILMIVLVFFAIGMVFYFMSTHRVLRGQDVEGSI